MNGAAALLELRRHRLRPFIVDVHIGRDFTESWRDWHEVGGMAHLEVMPDESIQRLDLRCLVRLWVVAGGLDQDRVRAFHAAAVAAGARVVMSTAYRCAFGELEPTLHLRHVTEH